MMARLKCRLLATLAQCQSLGGIPFEGANLYKELSLGDMAELDRVCPPWRSQSW
jgi:hypothetical protein